MFILRGPGEFEFAVSGEPTWEEHACVTAPGPAVVEVYLNKAMVDLVYVSGASHTWWGNNPLLPPRSLRVGDKVFIKITGKAAMRVEWPLCSCGKAD